MVSDVYRLVLRREEARRLVERQNENVMRRLGSRRRYARNGERMTVSFRLSRELVDALDQLVADGKALNRSQAIEDAFWVVVRHGLLDEIAQRAEQQYDPVLSERQRESAVRLVEARRKLLEQVREDAS